MVSAATAVAGLLLAVFGLPGSVVSSGVTAGRGQSGPRRRVELFVAGAAGQVHQPFVDRGAVSGGPAEQTRLFDTARARLRTDVR
ncbi:hypothetical protein ACSHWO_06895 [Streptomyces sp. HUAS TT3]|uniref:hypothetical protein n=1 Tax=Streptomyces sp. HUAS TT3 TaxID=3447510 RepID=UPI003F659016